MTPLSTSTDTFRYRLEFTDGQAALIASEPLSSADFHRAISETHFNGFRQGLFPSFAPDPRQAQVEPLFGAESSPERTNGFRVTVLRPDGGDFSQDFGVGYITARAGRLRGRILRDHHWPQEKPLYYALAAYLDNAAPNVLSRGLVSAGPAQVHLPLGCRPRSEFGETSEWDGPQGSELPVLTSRSLLEEACDEANQHPEREIGGLLLGNVHRDPDLGELFVEVTCLVSGEGTTPATATSVTFTPESFARARELIGLRTRAAAPPEIIVGWYHSHPFRLCETCPLPTPPECLQKVLFYSSDDLNVMESVFHQPYHVGLLAAVEPRIAPALGHLPVKLFGWRNGEAVARGFEVTND